MFETVSVDNALRRGRRVINFPILLFILLPAVSSISLVVFYHLSEWIVLGAFVSGFVLGWLYWSVQITRWRLWAFENVRNVHELKERAIKEKLIWPDGSIWEKTEIRTQAQKEKLAALQGKFKIADEFHDDYNIPAQTEIYYSKTLAIFNLVIGIAGIGLGVWLATGDNNKFIGAFAAIGGAYAIAVGVKRYNNKDAQITLSNEGIKTAKDPFFSWADIDSADTKTRSTGKNSTTYFMYSVADKDFEVKIDDLDTSSRKIDDLLRIYRARYEQKSVSKSKNAALDKLLG